MSSFISKIFTGRTNFPHRQYFRHRILKGLHTIEDKNSPARYYYDLLYRPKCFINQIAEVLSRYVGMMNREEYFKEGSGETLHEIYQRYHPQILTDFRDELEKYWGRRWKANSTIGKLRTVLLHRPGKEFLTVGKPTPWLPHLSSLAAWRMSFKPDLDELIEHHENMVKAYRDEGVEVVIRKPDPYDPPYQVKSIYTDDVCHAAVTARSSSVMLLLSTGRALPVTVATRAPRSASHVEKQPSLYWSATESPTAGTCTTSAMRTISVKKLRCPSCLPAVDISAGVRRLCQRGWGMGPSTTW